MRIVLQNQDSGFYVAVDGGWTLKKEEARDFVSIMEAEEYCRDRNLNLVAFALRGDSAYRLHLNCQKGFTPK